MLYMHNARHGVGWVFLYQLIQLDKIIYYIVRGTENEICLLQISSMIFHE